MATERQLPGPHSSPSDTRDGHFGGEHLLLGIFDTASLKGEHSYLGENSKSCDHENTIVVRRIENQQWQETGDNEKDWRHRDSGFKGGHRGHLRGECYFSGRSPDISRTGQDHTAQQVITRLEVQNVIRMCETIILELFTLAALTQGPGHTLHLPGGALAVFPEQAISSFATRSLHYRIISSLLFSHHRKYYLVVNNSQRKRKTFNTLSTIYSIKVKGM